MTTSNEEVLADEEPMGDLLQTPSGGYQQTPFLGLTAAKAAALVGKQVG